MYQQDSKTTQPETPSPTQSMPISPAVPVSRSSKRTKVALWLMIGPTGLLIATFILYALINFLTPASTPTNGELFGTPSPLHAIVNVALFGVGLLSFISWLPGMIVGIVLLATKK